MAKGFKHGAGGGGASLNFKVVGNPQPVSPKENTIWVDTDVEITSWIFSASEPETATQGMVSFFVATASTAPFNALKKNGIMVYPMSAKQYVDGAWVEREAKSYQNGVWVDWIRYVFKSGVGAIVPFENRTQANATVIFTDDCIIHSYTSGEIASRCVTSDAVPLKGYSTLFVRAKCTKSNGGSWDPRFGFYSDPKLNILYVTPDITSLTFIADSIEREYGLPIPSGLESAYIGVCGAFKAEIYDIWLE